MNCLVSVTMPVLIPIGVELKIEGDLSPEQIQRLEEISERCPVHRTLTGEVKIRTKVGDVV